MKRNITLFLEDILEQISLIETSVTEKNEFLQDRDIQDATIRRLEVIGEAAKNLPANVKEIYEDIEWQKIAGLRDIMIHAYFKVDLDIVWDIIKKDLPKLKNQIKGILRELKRS